MTLERIQLQFSTTPLAVSGAIRIATRSDFSHVDVVMNPGFPGLESLTPEPYGLLGASDPGGVMIRRSNYQHFLHRRRLTLETDKADAIVQALASQIGKPFDNESLLRVFDPNWRDWRDNGKWYCAELVAWALEEANFWDRRDWAMNINKAHITPEDILLLLAGEFDPAEFAKEVKE